MLERYVSRTFNSVVGIWGAIGLSLLFGILLAVLASHFLSKNEETGRSSFIGLCVGLVYCVLCILYWPLSFMDIYAGFILKISMITYGTGKTAVLLGFYITLLVASIRNRTSLPKKEKESM